MITVRYFAGARAAAGRAEESLPAQSLPTPATLSALTSTLTERHGPELGKVLAVASFLVDGVGWRDQERSLPDPAVVDVLPPFAGG